MGLLGTCSRATLAVVIAAGVALGAVAQESADPGEAVWQVLNRDGMLAAAETMRDAGADVIDVADSPMARMRMSPWAACRLIQDHVGIETSTPQFPSQGICNHHRTMTSTGAANAYSHIGFAFTLVQRQQIVKQIAKPAQSLFHFRLRS